MGVSRAKRLRRAERDPRSKDQRRDALLVAFVASWIETMRYAPTARDVAQGFLADVGETYRRLCTLRLRGLLAAAPGLARTLHVAPAGYQIVTAFDAESARRAVRRAARGHHHRMRRASARRVLGRLFRTNAARRVA